MITQTVTVNMKNKTKQNKTGASTWILIIEYIMLPNSSISWL
jgi:hypothetical protein